MAITLTAALLSSPQAQPQNVRTRNHTTGMATNHKHAGSAQPTGSAINFKTAQPRIKTEYAHEANSDSDEGIYKPRPQLPQPYVVMRTLADLMRDLNAGIIDVNPEYQREVVWTADRMTGLINSLMENFYIPPIVLNRKTRAAESNSQGHTLVCVDGKQRLSSVQAFIKGIIPCHDHRGEKWWYCESGRTRRKNLLPEETKKMFLAKEYVSFEFKDLTPDQEEELFARVQMGVQLSLAERMKASSGPWQELAKLFVDDFPDIYTLMKDRSRAKDFQLTLACFSQIVEVMHPSTENGIPILRTNYTSLPKLLSNKGAVDDGIKSHLAAVWTTFKDLLEKDPGTFTNANKYLRGVQTFAPVEMVSIMVLISMYSETRNHRLLLGDIQAFRLALRESFRDLRLHSDCWKFAWQYLDSLEAIRGAVDGSTINPRRNARLSAGTDRANALPQASGTLSAVGNKSSTITAGPVGSRLLKSDSIARLRVHPENTSEQVPKRRRIDLEQTVIPSSTAAGAISVTNATPISGTPSITPSAYVVPLPISSSANQHNTSQTMRDPRGKHTTQQPGSSQPMQTPPLPGSSQQPGVTNPSIPVPTLTSAIRQNYAPGAVTDRSAFASAPASGPFGTGPHGGSSHADLYITGLPIPQPDPRFLSSLPTHLNHLNIGRGSYTPQYTDQQWAGVLRSKTPIIPPSTTNTSRPQPPLTVRQTQRSQRSTSAQRRPMPIDQVVDLTSDTEEELQARQTNTPDLFSSVPMRKSESDEMRG